MPVMTALSLKCESPPSPNMVDQSAVEPSPPKADAQAAAARKRRRRAPAGGAADDCFTCSKRNVKCDRRRPYCSQCLEVGNECSGYKTQLTWGVGVASRGKLRGLSLPIAKSPPVLTLAGKKVSPTRPRAGPTPATNTWTDQQLQADRRVPPRHRPQQLDFSRQHHHPSEHAISAPATPFHASYDMASRVSNAEAVTQPHAHHWSHMPFSPSLPTEGMRFAKLAGPMSGEALSSSIDSLSDVDYLSPINHSFPREDIPFMHSPAVMYEGFTSHNSPAPQSPIAAMIMEQRSAPTSCPSLVYAQSEQGSSLSSHPDTFAAQLSSKLMLDCDSMVETPDMDAYSTSAQSNGHFWGPSAASDEDVPSQTTSELAAARLLAAWPTAMETQSPAIHAGADLFAKMQGLISVYEKQMCPSMVFIDGPHNPFREHILKLAADSRSLQHAICALAACNLRMKRKLSLGRHSPPPRRESKGTHHGVAIAVAEAAAVLSELPAADDSSLQEEYQHRNIAVHLLNEQLNDPAKSTHDSVLATILLLCHYRMAESGIAKFHTQFAGVKKILGMRRTSPFAPSRDSAWMEALFTYLDAITASINDREAQLNTSFYSLPSDAPLLPPGFENLVGCDRELFRIIIKLGRLNLLSQHRPVENLPGPSHLSRGSPSRSESPLHSPLGHAYKPGNHHHLNHLDIYGHQPHNPTHLSHRFDGNGFTTTLDDEEIMSAAIGSSPAYDDHRSAFWREWKEARNALQVWKFDPQRVMASLSAGATPPTSSQVRDLGSLSEAFRYAALLYTERLASPGVPSSQSSFRDLVSQVIYHATSLDTGSQAERFLLWPLVIAGGESQCVNEQKLIRSKCYEIMARSGYMNNLAALDVLERLWASADGRDEAREDNKLSSLGIMRRGSPFNWAKYIGGPGIDVEWIMF